MEVQEETFFVNLWMGGIQLLYENLEDMRGTSKNFVGKVLIENPRIDKMLWDDIGSILAMKHWLFWTFGISPEYIEKEWMQESIIETE